MTTETKTEKTETPASNDNKAVFGPLGKYAAIAVIMVSIIVTTAIMLDRQLQSVDEQIAAIEDEVASIHAAESNIPEETAVIVTTAQNTEVAEVEVIEEVADESVAVVEAIVETPATVETAVETVATPVAEAAVVETATPVAAAVTEPAQTAPAAQFEMAAAENNAAQARQQQQQQLAKENQARIEAYKQEQKQHMSEMFARINALETQQLGRYKANQDDQVVRLREQISQQQQMIEALVQRNKKLFELRAASMQRKQDNREQALNRI